MPTKAEYDALVAAATSNKWGTIDGINGVTLITDNGTLFFPAAGFRGGTGSGFGHRTGWGYYWSANQGNWNTAWELVFSTGVGARMSSYIKPFAYSIRCVRPYSIEVNPVGEVLVEGTRSVYWAKTNVGAKANSFEAAETGYGGLFLWDSATAYTYGGTTPPNFTSSATTWQSVNNPCPAGWEVPTRQDFYDLYGTSTAKTWGANGEINGLTFTSPNGSLFFPAAGFSSWEYYLHLNERGWYWSATQADATNAYELYFHATTIQNMNPYYKYNGRSLRCVRPKIE